MEWQLSRDWVISTGVALDNRSIQSSESLHDFVASLRDGVILCGVVNAMKPYCVEYSTRKIENIDQHEFLCKRNITLFLRTCREVFNIKSKDLFKTSDLYDVTNFGAVVNTLSVLSHHQDAIAMQGCQPFSVASISEKCKEDNYDIYGSLVEGINKAEMHTYTRDTSGDIYKEKYYCNSAYESLIYHTSPPLDVAPPTPIATSGKREHIVNEILNTEEEYIKLIGTIVQSYIPALEPHITGREQMTIFLNIGQIYRHHMNFYRELSSPTSTSDSGQTIDISAFSRYKERFLIYAYYCTHLEESQRLLDQLLKKPAFRNTVDELNRKLKRKALLKGQLCVCFQRVLKYPLLLADLVKNTQDEDNEHRIAKNALIAMEDVANYINEFKRDHDVVLEIEHIQSTLKFPDIAAIAGRQKSLYTNFGRHMHDGELQVQFEGTERREKFITFLFEKALLLCKQNGDFNDVHDILYLHQVIVKDSQPHWKRKFEKTEGKFSYCFTLKTSEESDCSIPARSCRIFTKTEQLKQSWMGAIRICIKLITLKEYEGKLNNHLFRLLTFDCDEYSTCDVCKKLLLGQVSQGYLCENDECKLLVHKTCLENCPPCKNLSSENIPFTPDSVVMRTICVSRVRRKQIVDEATAWTINQSINSEVHQEWHN